MARSYIWILGKRDKDEFMNINGYFGVRSLEAIVGIKSLDSKAQVALFLGVGLAVYGYFKYGKKENNNGKRKEA